MRSILKSAGKGSTAASAVRPLQMMRMVRMKTKSAAMDRAPGIGLPGTKLRIVDLPADGAERNNVGHDAPKIPVHQSRPRDLLTICEPRRFAGSHEKLSLTPSRRRA
jgi:hypothetical protein